MLKVLITFVFLAVCGLAAAQDDCYSKLRDKGLALAYNGRYTDAIKKFEAAMDCFPDKPAQNDLDQQIAEAKRQRKAYRDEQDRKQREAEEAENRRLEMEQKQREADAAEKKKQKDAADEAERLRTQPHAAVLRQIAASMVYISDGTFYMGDNFNDSKNETWGETERPVHPVSVAGFRLSIYEVKQSWYKDIMGENPAFFKGDEDLPVEMVSWDDALLFIKKLNELSGLNYRLPSEAEWEFAARERGRTNRFGNGGDICNPSEINFNGKESYKKSYSIGGTYRGETVPVGSLSKNALGLFNMSGNVYEWCQDFWHNSYEGAPSSGSAWIIQVANPVIEWFVVGLGRTILAHAVLPSASASLQVKDTKTQDFGWHGANLFQFFWPLLRTPPPTFGRCWRPR